jgi:PAS domain S-box-containing protein
MRFDGTLGEDNMNANGAALLEAERLAAALDLAEVAVRRFDGTILHWSHGMRDLYGFAPEEAVGRVSHDLLRTEFPTPLPQINKALLRDGQWRGELVHHARDGKRMIVTSRWRLHREAPREKPLVVVANADVTALHAAKEVLAANEERVLHSTAELQAIYGNAPLGLALVNRDLRFVSVNRLLAEMNGVPVEAHAGRTLREVLPPLLAERLEPLYRRVLATGEPVAEMLVGETVAAPGQTRHWRVGYHPVRDETGVVWAVCALVQDVTERVGAEQARDTIARELRHGVQNLLAMVQGLAARTARDAGGHPERFIAEFGSRLAALGRASNLLNIAAWQPVRCAALARAALEPWLPKGIDLTGCEPEEPHAFVIGRGQAQALALALHELATNAVSHGAWSLPGGHVAVRCAQGADGVAHIDWTETEGPKCPPRPAKGGFGTWLLQQALPRQLGTGAKVSLDFQPTGLRVSIRFLPSVSH